MGAEDSIKKLKRKEKTKRMREEEDLETVSSQLAQKARAVRNLVNEEDRQKKTKIKRKKKKSSVDLANKVDAELFRQPNIQANETQRTSDGNKKSKKLRRKKIRNGKITRTRVEYFVRPQSNEAEDGISGKKYVERDLAEDKLQKTRKKKNRKNAESNKVDEFNEKDDVSEQRNEAKPDDHTANSEGLNRSDKRRSTKTCKSKKPGKTKRKRRPVENELSPDNLLESRGEDTQSRGEDTQDEVYQMSSGDEDYSKGMKKWITQYHQSRPGLKLLQERIDDFIIAHEAQEEKARLEREAQAAEGGWTVVVHHKGRKKTTEAETGIAVGSVAQAAVADKMAKKKTKEVGIDFYRFQKREAHRNEIMMLQSKFEQDKKRIQQMRAARKFRPY